MLIAELGVAAAQVFSLALVTPPLAAGPSVDFDLTVGLQGLLFLGLVIVLKPLLFDPMLRVFAERELRTEGARAEARALEEQAAELLRQYRQEFERMNRAASEERERVRSETSRLEAEILNEARERATKIVDDGRLSMAHEVTAHRLELERQSSRLAQEVAAAVLGREVR